MAYIYSITNLTNNKLYIGKTTQPNPYDRWKQHLQNARSKNNTTKKSSIHSMPIVHAISKYGSDNFKFRVIEECTDDNVNIRESYWIEKYNACGKNGYNVTLGGEGVKKPRKYWGNHPSSKKVSCFTLDGKWIKDYDTCGVAADTLGNKKASNSIRSCINGITFQSLEYRWAWKGEQPKMIEKRVNRRGKIYGVNLITGEKKCWKSQADCAQEINGDRKNNNALTIALNRNNENAKSMTQVKGWYLFRDKTIAQSNWKPANKTRSIEYYKKISAISKEKRRQPIYGIHIKTQERVDFNSITEASFFIKGEGNNSATGNITRNIKKLNNGEIWSHAFGYRWYRAF
jgi:hypothetical protein